MPAPTWQVPVAATKTSAVKYLLDKYTHPDLAKLYNHGMEMQVEVAQDGGEETGGVCEGHQWTGWTDGRTTWKNFRIPLNANTEPKDNDAPLNFNLEAHAQGIGLTGWDWVQKVSKFVGFDFDSISGHAVGLTDAELEEVKQKAMEIPWVTVRRSTSGRGIHLYVFLPDVPTANHTEHAALARVVLDQMSELVGFNFSEAVDCAGWILWFWHRKMKGTDGLTLLKQGKVYMDVPANWRDQIPGGMKRVTPKRVKPTGAQVLAVPQSDRDQLFDEFTGDSVPLGPEHKKLLEWVQTHRGVADWNAGSGFLSTHTVVLKEAYAALGLRGSYETVSQGTDLGKANCWARPLPDGAWQVGRYGNVREADTWKPNQKGEPRCILNPVTKQQETAGPGPEIRITTRADVVVGQAVDALAAEPALYQRGGRLTSVRRDLPEIKGFKRQPNSPIIAVLPKPVLMMLLAKNAFWKKWSQDARDWVPALPAPWAVETVHALGEWRGIRPLKAVVESPVLRPDGSILATPGWDHATELFYEPSTVFPAVPDRPTLDDVKRAVNELLAIVVDFPFANDAHRVAWLAALLTPLARHAIAGPCPLFLFDATTAGAGKTKLVDIISIIVTGRGISRTAYPDSEEEMRKRLTAVALAGDPLMLIDNVATEFGGQALDAALTSETWSDRILGKTQMVAKDLPFVVNLYATGNNVEIKGDIFRRIITSRLEPQVEKPEERTGFTIEGNLLAHVKTERPRLVTAALTLLRAHAVAGRPSSLTPYGSFEPWSDVVRCAIYWATGSDPCETRKGLLDSDPEATARTALIRGWLELPGGSEGLTAKQALELIQTGKGTTLRDALLPDGGKLPNPVALGKKLKAVKGRVIGGKVFKASPNRDDVQEWRVERVVS